MPLLFSDCKEVVKGRLKEQYKEMRQYVTNAKPPLWGEQRPRNFVAKVFVLAMYHDVTGIGYNKILEGLEDLGFNYNIKSYKYNTKSIRRTLAKWGKQKVKLGDLEEWKQSMRNVPHTKKFPGLCFWMDSTDFPMVNRGEGGRKIHTGASNATQEEGDT